MDANPKILVTGSNGQLGKELQQLLHLISPFDFIFLSRADLPIHHFEMVGIISILIIRNIASIVLLIRQLTGPSRKKTGFFRSMGKRWECWRLFVKNIIQTHPYFHRLCF